MKLKDSNYNLHNYLLSDNNMHFSLHQFSGLIVRTLDDNVTNILMEISAAFEDCKLRQLCILCLIEVIYILSIM